MNFANIALLGGAFAFLAPLVIHLLNRSRFQTVEWGAMHLLDEAMQVNSRRLQWESWLLLFIRCLIPVALAFCLARPVLTALKISGADEPQSIVFLLDDTFSMQAKSQSNPDESNFAIAQKMVLDIASQSASYRNSEKAIVTFSGIRTSLNGITTDNVRLSRSLDKLEPRSGQSQFADAIAQTQDLLSSMSHSNRQVIVLSDFLAADWESSSRPGVEMFRSAFESQPKTRLTFVQVNKPRQFIEFRAFT